MLTSGWIGHARRLGRIVIFAVLACGVGIAAAGLVRTIAPAIVLLAMAGYADGVSALCRSTINQTVTPDALRGPRLGDIESGLVAGLTSAMPSVVSGGARLRRRRRRGVSRLPRSRPLRRARGRPAQPARFAKCRAAQPSGLARCRTRNSV